MSTNQSKTFQFSIEKPSKESFSTVNQLIDDNFGYNFHKTKSLSTNNTIVLVALCANEIIAVGIGKMNSELNEATMDLYLVDEQHRNKGVGTAIFEATLIALIDLQPKTIQLHHWIKENVPQPLIAIKRGFQLESIQKDYWKESSLFYNYHCDECGTPPCTCSCATYQLTL